tara:strand:- start:96 stop:1244 length:1149 start_codon:yes stop_codon:yes gene_type:complete
MILENNSKIDLYPYSSSLTLSEILLGLNAHQEYESLIAKYVEQIIKFLSNQTNDFDITLPLCFTEHKDLNYGEKVKILSSISHKYSSELVDERGSQKVKINFPFEELKRIFYVFEGQILIAPGLEPHVKQYINDLLTDILTSSFKKKNIVFGTYSDRTRPNLSIESLKCFASPRYLEWCVKNIEDFVIADNIITKEYEIASLESFKVIPINHEKNNSYNHVTDLNGMGLDFDKRETLLFEPIINRQIFTFSAEAIQINNEKISKIKVTENIKKINEEKYFILLSYIDSVINETNQRVMVTELNETSLMDRDLPLSNLRPFQFSHKKTHTIIMAWDTPTAESIRNKINTNKLIKLDLNKCVPNLEKNNGYMETVHYYFDVILP